MPPHHRPTEGRSVATILSPWLAELRRVRAALVAQALPGLSAMPVPPRPGEECTIVVIGNTVCVCVCVCVCLCVCAHARVSSATRALVLYRSVLFCAMLSLARVRAGPQIKGVPRPASRSH